MGWGTLQRLRKYPAWELQAGLPPMVVTGEGRTDPGPAGCPSWAALGAEESLRNV